MARQFGNDAAEEFDERAYAPPKKRKVKITKPTYADFKETRDGKNQLTCECGSQVWQLWDDHVAACGICGLPEPIISFSLRGAEEAEEFLDNVMNP
jgi:hypothetical protein